VLESTSKSKKYRYQAIKHKEQSKLKINYLNYAEYCIKLYVDY